MTCCLVVHSMLTLLEWPGAMVSKFLRCVDAPASGPFGDAVMLASETMVSMGVKEGDLVALTCGCGADCKVINTFPLLSYAAAL